jgi:hypothetical protein
VSDSTPRKPSLAAFKKFVRAVADVPRRELDEKIAKYELRRRLPRARRKRTA